MSEFFLSVRNFFIICMTFISAIVFCNTPERATKDVITDEETVRIMSFNIRYNEYEDRFRIVPQLIGDYMPDSVGLQECTHDWYLTMGAFLKEYGIIGVGRDTGDTSIYSGEMSAILYRKDKYKVVDSGNFWISETPDEISYGWDAETRRICTWAILENKSTGEQYAHVNVHLDHISELARVHGAEMVSEFALTFDMPTVLTGDFNFKKHTSYYDIVASSGLRDSQDIAVTSDEGKTYHGYNGGTEGLPIDFIFVNDEIESISTYKIVRDTYGGKYSSDHYPIYADMKF